MKRITRTESAAHILIRIIIIVMMMVIIKETALLGQRERDRTNRGIMNEFSVDTDVLDARGSLFTCNKYMCATPVGEYVFV